MTAQLIDGKSIASQIIEKVRLAVAERRRQGQRAPGLAVVRVGEDPASEVYVRNKLRACERCGVRPFAFEPAVTIAEDELLTLIARLNADPDVDGILVQLPLPGHIDSDAVIEAIDPRKDIDGFHPCNIGRLALGLPGLRPCTPRGVMTLLQVSEIEVNGQDAVIIGRSTIVGRPMALELIRASATVTVCHSRTRGLPEKAANADLLIAAVGHAHFVPGEWIKPGAVVIDVGVNRLEDGSLTGDVDFRSAMDRAAWITPVPGGVGPMTVASLLENTLEAAAAGNLAAP